MQGHYTSYFNHVFQLHSVPGPPSLQLNPAQVQDRSVLIFYRLPEFPNGIILRYHLTAQPTSNFCASERHVEIKATSASSLYGMYGLDPGITYNFCLAAENSAGIGEADCSEASTKGGTYARFND